MNQETPVSTPPRAAKFRQTVLWPVQLIVNEDNHQIHKHWEYLNTAASNTPWKAISDEFSSASSRLSEARYKEFVTFMPFAQRFLYGEGKHGEETGGYGESPIHIFSREDIAEVRLTFEQLAEPIVLKIAHVDLYFFFDIDVAILAVEITGEDLAIHDVMDILFRFGRTYPSYWHKNGNGGHCAQRVEWLNHQGNVVATSDYEKKHRYLEFVKQHHVPCVSSHWEYLMQPLVQHFSDDEGTLRYREIEYQRMPLMSYLAFDDISKLTRADMVRLGLGTRPGDSNKLPYTEEFLADFETRYCYDRYWDIDQEDEWHSTRFMCTGQNFFAIGSDQHSSFTDEQIGIISQYKNQHFLLFLIAHFQKAALLMLSDRLVQAISRLDIDDPDSIKGFRLNIRHTMEVFLRFTHRYWFEAVSDQAVSRDIFSMMRNQLETQDLYERTRKRIMDMAEYLEGEEIRRQADTVVRLTVVTILGLIGTMTSGLLGMNLLDLTSISMPSKIMYFLAVFIPVTILTFYTVVKSRRLSLFLDALSNERINKKSTLHVLRNVWSKNPPAE